MKTYMYMTTCNTTCTYMFSFFCHNRQNLMFNYSNSYLFQEKNVFGFLNCIQSGNFATAEDLLQ